MLFTSLCTSSCQVLVKLKYIKKNTSHLKGVTWNRVKMSPPETLNYLHFLEYTNAFVKWFVCTHAILLLARSFKLPRHPQLLKMFPPKPSLMNLFFEHLLTALYILLLERSHDRKMMLACTRESVCVRERDRKRRERDLPTSKCLEVGHKSFFSLCPLHRTQSYVCIK